MFVMQGLLALLACTLFGAQMQTAEPPFSSAKQVLTERMRNSQVKKEVELTFHYVNDTTLESMPSSKAVRSYDHAGNVIREEKWHVDFYAGKKEFDVEPSEIAISNYDKRGRLVATYNFTPKDSNQVIYRYDSLDHLVEEATESSVTGRVYSRIVYGYDGLGRLSEEVDYFLRQPVSSF